MSILNRPCKGFIQGIIAIYIGSFGGLHQSAQAVQLADENRLYCPSSEFLGS